MNSQTVDNRINTTVPSDGATAAVSRKRALTRKEALRSSLPLLVRAAKAAHLSGTSEASWWRWHAAGLCPSGLRIRGQRLWSRRELVLWVRWKCPPRAEFEARLAAHDKQ